MSAESDSGSAYVPAGMVDRAIGEVHADGLGHAAPLHGHETGAVAHTTGDVEEPPRPLNSWRRTCTAVGVARVSPGRSRRRGRTRVGDDTFDRAGFVAHGSGVLAGKATGPMAGGYMWCRCLSDSAGRAVEIARKRTTLSGHPRSGSTSNKEDGEEDGRDKKKYMIKSIRGRLQERRSWT